MCPLKISGSFYGPSGFVPPGRPAALPAGCGSVGVDHVNGSGGSRAGGGTSRARQRTSRVRHSPPALTPDNTTRPTEPTAPTFLHRIVRHRQPGRSQHFPLGRPPSTPAAALRLHRCTPLPHSTANPEPIRQRRTLETTRPEGHPHAHSGEPHHHKPPTCALRLRRSTPALQPGPDSTNNTKPQVKSLTWGSKRAAFGIRTRDLRITRP